MLALSVLTKAANPKFFIASKCNNKSAESYIAFLESEFSNALQKEFPCVETLSNSDMLVLLNHEKQKQFLGKDDFVELSKFGEAMGSDYLVSLQVSVFDNLVSINTFCADTRKSKVIARATISTNHGNPGIGAVEKVSKQLVEGLKNYEICPFTGPINIVVKTELTDKKSESYSVYCNGIDGLYKLDIFINKTSDANWRLIKTSKNKVSGSVTYSLLENMETEEQNDCYACASGRKGARMYKEKILKSANVEGLSNESVADEQQIEDARAVITFFDNGTYTLKVKAASKRGNLKIITEKHAEGTCDNQNTPPEIINKKADVPLNEVTFGPFSGTSLDKVLINNGKITTIDPVTKEKTTITFDYNLKRD